MKQGQTYEVFVGGQPVGLVGSTVRMLKQRRGNGYTKRFGPGVELHLIREVPRPEGYSDSDFNFYLKACEAMDIASKRAYVEYGGLNKISPLIQALGHQILDSERGRIGGRIGGHNQPREAKVKGGHNQPREAKVKGGRRGARAQPRESRVRGGQTTKKSGTGIFAFGMQAKGGFTQPKEAKILGGYAAGKVAVKSGQLAKVAPKGGRVSMCKRWQISRGKPCVCGEHT